MTLAEYAELAELSKQVETLALAEHATAQAQALAKFQADQATAREAKELSLGESHTARLSKLVNRMLSKGIAGHNGVTRVVKQAEIAKALGLSRNYVSVLVRAYNVALSANEGVTDKDKQVDVTAIVQAISKGDKCENLDEVRATYSREAVTARKADNTKAGAEKRKGTRGAGKQTASEKASDKASEKATATASAPSLDPAEMKVSEIVTFILSVGETCANMAEPNRVKIANALGDALAMLVTE